MRPLEMVGNSRRVPARQPTEEVAPPEDMQRLVHREVEEQLAKASVGASAADFAALRREVGDLRQRLARLEVQSPALPCTKPASSVAADSLESSRDRGIAGVRQNAEFAALIAPTVPNHRSRDLSAELEDGWVREPPETIFAYCVWKLANSEEPLSDLALFKMLLMLVIQVVLVFGFMNCLHLQYESFAFHDNTGEDIAGQTKTEMSVSVCWYMPMVFRGQPIIDIACSLLVMVLVASRLMVQDMQTLTTAYPEPLVPNKFIQALVNYIWWVQACWLPVMLGNSAALLLATSGNVEDVVFNALALTFLLDIDDMMYQSFVTTHMKRKYVQSAALIAINIDHADSNSMNLCAIAAVQCLAAYTYFNASLRAGIFGMNLFDVLERGLAIFVLFYGIRFAVFHRVGGGPKCLSSLPCPYLWYMLLGLAGFMHYLLLNALFQPKFIARWIVGPQALLKCF